MFQIIFLIVILFVFSLFFIKVKIEVTMEEELCIDVSILKYLKLKRITFNEDEIKEIKTTSQKVAKEEFKNYLKNIEFTDAKLFIKSLKELLNKVRIEKLDFSFNINIDDYILNSYIVTFVNSVVAIMISKNIEKINTEKLSYVITSNEKKIKLNLKCIMYGKLANIIFVSGRIIYYAFKLKKRGNDKHGKGTSNRKSNGNSNDVARVNG